MHLHTRKESIDGTIKYLRECVIESSPFYQPYTLESINRILNSVDGLGESLHTLSDNELRVLFEGYLPKWGCSLCGAEDDKLISIFSGKSICKGCLDKASLIIHT